MKSRKRYLGESGETMIEVILSLAIVAVTLLMVTVLLGTASRVYVRSYKQETDFEKQLNALNTGTAKNAGQPAAEGTFGYNGMKTGEAETRYVVDVKMNLLQGTASDSTTMLFRFKAAD